MKSHFLSFIFIFVTFIISVFNFTDGVGMVQAYQISAQKENLLEMSLVLHDYPLDEDAKVIIQLYPDKAPLHVQRIKELVSDGFYDNLTFHRVIAGFMAQTGDPLGNGTGGSDKPDLHAEFNDVHHEKGVVSMARSNDPDSANSQFFIMLGNGNWLDGQYTVFGRVISGMQYVDRIKLGDSSNNGMVEHPADRIAEMSLLSDDVQQKLLSGEIALDDQDASIDIF